MQSTVVAPGGGDNGGARLAPVVSEPQHQGDVVGEWSAIRFATAQGPRPWVGWIGGGEVRIKPRRGQRWWQPLLPSPVLLPWPVRLTCASLILCPLDSTGPMRPIASGGSLLRIREQTFPYPKVTTSGFLAPIGFSGRHFSTAGALCTGRHRPACQVNQDAKCRVDPTAQTYPWKCWCIARYAKTSLLWQKPLPQWPLLRHPGTKVASK